MIKTTLICLFVGWSSFAISQSLTPEIITTSGHLLEQPAIGSLHGTIGEPVNGILENDLKLTQGFQQYYLKITPVYEINQVVFDWNIYPNPTLDKVHFKTDLTGEITLELLDLNGRILMTKSVESGQSDFSLGRLPDALYLLRLKKGNQHICSWKILKNNR